MYKFQVLEGAAWGSWGCLAWRKEGSGETLLCFTMTLKEVVSRWGSGSSPRHQVIRQREMASSCTGGGLDWVLGEFLYRKGCAVLEQAAQGSSGVTIPGGL